ncbi:MAG: septum formation initiator family protein [bacterium]
MMAKPRSNSSRKRPKPKPTYGLLWLPVFIFFLMLSGLAVFYVWERIKLREISREIIELNKTRKLLVEENERLRAQAEELASYRRIYPIAKERFGFVELKPRIIYMPVGRK